MAFTPASSSSLFAFVLIVILVLLAIVAGVYLACRRTGEAPFRPTLVTACVLALWVCLFSVAVATKVIARLPMPGIPIVMGASLLGAVVFAMSASGRRLTTLSWWMLVGFQSFRSPLELVLHVWAKGRTVPETMTWTGSNFDIISGGVALVVALLLLAMHERSSLARTLAWCANAVGAVLLLNVIRVAAMSSPLPFSWHVDPPLLLLTRLPYALIAPVCVGGALAGHLVLTRSLLKARRLDQRLRK